MWASNGQNAEANTQLVRSAVAAINDHDAERLLALVASDMVIHYAELPEPLVGRDTWLHGFQAMAEAFPDFQVEVEDLVAAGDRVALRVRITGTHTGEFQGIPATGRRISYVSHEFYRLVGDSVAEEWICSDMASLFAQLR